MKVIRDSNLVRSVGHKKPKTGRIHVLTGLR